MYHQLNQDGGLFKLKFSFAGGTTGLEDSFEACASPAGGGSNSNAYTPVSTEDAFTVAKVVITATYDTVSPSYYVGYAIDDNVPAVPQTPNCMSVQTYASADFPSGLATDASTGAITGTPDTLTSSHSTSVTVTCASTRATGTGTLTFAVLAVPTGACAAGKYGGVITGSAGVPGDLGDLSVLEVSTSDATLDAVHMIA